MLLPVHAPYPSHLITPHLARCANRGAQCAVCSPVTPHPLWRTQRIFLSILFSQTPPNLCSFLNVRNQISHPYKKAKLQFRICKGLFFSIANGEASDAGPSSTTDSPNLICSAYLHACMQFLFVHVVPNYSYMNSRMLVFCPAFS